ncbi:MAG: hypothetical protein WDO19_13610 [Bacteroidota bacterium]
MIRTQELLSARRIDGGEQFFSRAYDFGYSKNPEETFTKWDREKNPERCSMGDTQIPTRHYYYQVPGYR